jgi:hypothetical protein
MSVPKSRRRGITLSGWLGLVTTAIRMNNQKRDAESAAAIARAKQRREKAQSESNSHQCRYVTVPCNGFNPRTGRRVGSRHRWEGCTCKWCGKFKDMVRIRVKTD